MPLKKGSSSAVVSENLDELKKAGYPLKQRLAIVLERAKKFKKDSK